MNVSSFSRRRRGRKEMGDGDSSRRSPLAAGLGAALVLLVGRASSRPALEPDPASAGALLSDRARGGRYIGGWSEGVFDSLALAGSICPGQTSTDEVEALVATALKFAPPDEPGVIAASRALRAIWPCSAEPINSKPAPAIQPPAKAASAA